MSLSKMSTLDIPISIRWKLSKATIEAQSPGMWCISTEKFSIGQLPDVQYFLVLACALSADDKVTMGLIIEKKEPLSMKISCKLGIPSVDRTIHDNEESTDKKHIFASDIAPADDILDPSNNYLINDDLIIVMEAVLTVENPVAAAVAEFQMKADSLGPLFWSRDDKDFTVVVDCKQIKVHKLVIGAKSLVFDRMIQSGLAETKESKVTFIDFSYEIVEFAIKYCYGIDDGKLLTLDAAIDLMQFADKYDIGDLKASTETYLSSKISPMNVCDVAKASVLSNAVNLREKCLDFMLECHQKRIFIMNLDRLDKDFRVELLKASFSQCV